MNDIAKQLNLAEDQLNSAFQERRDVIRAAILALLCAEHLFILGLPGAAKSLIIRTLVAIFRGASYFEVAFSKRRPIEAVVGPVDLPMLREGHLVYKREGYATKVDLMFGDEVGKMSDVVGHDMLALFNERKYHEVRDGKSVHDAPLSTAFTASNEMLTGQSDDAAALDDRLLLRVEAKYIQDRSNFVALLRSTETPSVDVQIDWADMKQVITQVVPKIPVNDAAIAALVDLRYSKFPDAGYLIGDRRWKQCVKVLQASAFLAGREEATPEDIASLQYALWMTPDQRDKVERLCLIASNPFAQRLFDIRDIIDGVNEELARRELLDRDDFNRRDYGPDATAKLTDCRDRLDVILMEAAGAPIPMFKTVSDYHRSTLIRMFTGILDQPQEIAETVMLEGELGSGDGGNR